MFGSWATVNIPTVLCTHSEPSRQLRNTSLLSWKCVGTTETKSAEFVTSKLPQRNGGVFVCLSVCLSVVCLFQVGQALNAKLAVASQDASPDFCSRHSYISLPLLCGHRHTRGLVSRGRLVGKTWQQLLWKQTASWATKVTNPRTLNSQF